MSAVQHQAFERLLSDLSNAFAMSAAEDLDRQIDQWLQKVTEFLGLEGAATAEYAVDGRSGRITRSWMAPGLPPLPEQMDAANWPWVADQQLKGRPVGFRSTADLPPDARADTQTYDRLGIKSCLSVPISCGGVVIGSLALGTFRYHRQWPEPLTHRIRLVGEIFGAALARKRAQEEPPHIQKEE
jgi:formate hydrogenlyase transcriptional activator